jgi:XRE family transcriptional regulator, aerobic/anaerobic benzoate catabolism transcriptional regulator
MATRPRNKKPAQPAAADHDPLLARLGAAVRDQRARRGWTLRRLAEASGLSLRFVSQLEGGQANIAIGRLAQVADAVGVPLPSLLDPNAGQEHGPADRIAALLRGRSPAELERCRLLLERELAAGGRRVVALLGLRGAGKSTLGPGLADALEVPFVELDQEVEREAGLSLTELFSLHGEQYYRELEVRVLGELLEAGRPCVVALSGGVVHNEEAFALVRERCLTVWLKAKPEDHMQRVLAQGDRRPIDRSHSRDAMAELRRLLARREPLYRQAEVVVDTSRQGGRSLAALRQAVSDAGWVVQERQGTS